MASSGVITTRVVSEKVRVIRVSPIKTTDFDGTERRKSTSAHRITSPVNASSNRRSSIPTVMEIRPVKVASPAAPAHPAPFKEAKIDPLSDELRWDLIRDICKEELGVSMSPKKPIVIRLGAHVAAPEPAVDEKQDFRDLVQDIPLATKPPFSTPSSSTASFKSVSPSASFKSASPEGSFKTVSSTAENVDIEEEMGLPNKFHYFLDSANPPKPLHTPAQDTEALHSKFHHSALISSSAVKPLPSPAPLLSPTLDTPLVSRSVEPSPAGFSSHGFQVYMVKLQSDELNAPQKEEDTVPHGPNKSGSPSHQNVQEDVCSTITTPQALSPTPASGPNALSKFSKFNHVQQSETPVEPATQFAPVMMVAQKSSIVADHVHSLSSSPPSAHQVGVSPSKFSRFRRSSQEDFQCHLG